MYSKSISTILDALKKRVGDQKFITIQQTDGELLDVTFSWSNAADSIEIERLKQLTGWTLPKDYEQFLLLHNGAILFQEVESKMSGVRLFSIDQILEYFNEYDQYYRGTYPEQWFMIGDYHGYGEYFFIDSNRVKQGRTDYLVCVQVGNIIELSMNFSTWLDRLIVCQGERFWLWN